MLSLSESYDGDVAPLARREAADMLLQADYPGSFQGHEAESPFPGKARERARRPCLCQQVQGFDAHNGIRSYANPHTRLEQAR